MNEQHTHSNSGGRTEGENNRTIGAAAGGALLGASLGGPFGAVIGGIIGIVFGELANAENRNKPI